MLYLLKSLLAYKFDWLSDISLLAVKMDWYFYENLIIYHDQQN